MIKRGLGAKQLDEIETSEAKILKVLSKGEWVRYGEIVKKGELSQATVSKYLKKFEEKGRVEKKIDIASKEYPYPVSYKILSEGLNEYTKIQAIQFLEQFDNALIFECPNDEGRATILASPHDEDSFRGKLYFVAGVQSIHESDIKEKQLHSLIPSLISHVLQQPFFEGFKGPAAMVFLWNQEKKSDKTG